MVRISTAFLACVSLLAHPALAQDPDFGFENWPGVDPSGWVTSNMPVITLFPVTKSTDAHSGTYAVRGGVVSFPITGTAFSPLLQSGLGGHGFPVSVRYTEVTGYYKFSPLGGDKLALNFGMFSGGKYIATGAEAITAAASGWTQFSVTFNYTVRDIPDTCILQISIVGPVTGPDCHPGTYFLLDDLSLSTTSGVGGEDSRLLSYALEQNYPNPFNPSTTIRYSLPHKSSVILRVFNSLAQEVATLVNESQDSGSHEVRFDGSALASGVYFYRLEAGDFRRTKTLTLIK